MLHYLRIAVTALSLTACVLLVALCVRSYYHGDLLYVKVYGWEFKTFSTQGFTQSENYTGTDDGDDASFKLEYDTFPPDEAPSLWFDFNKSRTELGFTYITTEEGDYLILRHWLIALLFAVIAVIPWLRWRFSLRTLLIATTLVAVGLGIIAAAQ